MRVQPLSEQRLHPVAIWVSFASYARQNLFVIIGALFVGSREVPPGGRDLSILWLIVPVMLLTILPALLRYATYRYRLDESELVIRSGWLFRQERSIPYQRIQSLDAKAGPFHRMFDAVSVSVETGGGVEADGEIDAVSRAAFEQMRHRVLTASGAAATAEQAPAANSIVRLSPGETILAGFILGREMLLVGGAVALLYEFGLGDRVIEWLFGGDTDLPGSLAEVVRAAGLGALTPATVAAALLLLLLLVLLVRLVTAVITALRFWDHRLDRVEDDLRVTCGAISRSTSTTPIQRIQSLTIREGPWHRLAGRVTVQVATAGGVQLQQSVASRETLAPLLRNAQLDALAAVALRGLTLPADGWRRLPARAGRRVLVGRGTTLVIAVALAWWIHFALAAVIALTGLVWLIAAVARVGCFRWNSFDGGLALRSGWIWRRTTVVRDDRIQLAVLEQSPFDRRWDMATVQVDTAGSAAPRFRCRYLEHDDARQLAHRIDRIVATVPFQV